MATTLTITRAFGWSGTFDNSGDTGAPGAKMPISVTGSRGYTDGSSDNQGDVVIFERSTPAAAADTWDLTGGLTDIYGNTVTLAKIREIWIHNLSTTSGELLTLGGNVMSVLGGAAGDTPIIHPNGHWIMAAPIDGYAVVGAASDALTVDPGANTISYDMRIIGVKA